MESDVRSFTMHRDLLRTIATKQNVDLESGIIEAVRNAYFAFEESGVGDTVHVEVSEDRVIISDNGPGFRSEKDFSEFGKVRKGRYGIGRMQTIRSARELEDGRRDIVIHTLINGKPVEIFDINLKTSTYRIRPSKMKIKGTTITIHNKFNPRNVVEYLAMRLKFFDYALFINGQQINRNFHPTHTGINNLMRGKHFLASLRLANDTDRKTNNRTVRLYICGIYTDAVEILGGAVVGLCKITSKKANYTLSEAVDISRKTLDLYHPFVQEILSDLTRIGLKLYNTDYGMEESDRRLFKFICLSPNPDYYLKAIPRDFVPAINGEYHDPRGVETIYYTDTSDMKAKSLIEKGAIVIENDPYLMELVRRVNPKVKFVPVISHKDMGVEGYEKYRPTEAEKKLLAEIRHYVGPEVSVGFGSEYWFNPYSGELVFKREKGTLPDYSEEYLYDASYISKGIDAEYALQNLRESMLRIIGVMALLMAYRKDSRVDKFDHSEVMSVRLYRRFLNIYLNRYEMYEK